jgi:hypothetical protein
VFSIIEGCTRVERRRYPEWKWFAHSGFHGRVLRSDPVGVHVTPRSSEIVVSLRLCVELLMSDDTGVRRGNLVGLGL